MLLSYLAEHLVELELVAYRKNTAENVVSLDCLSAVHHLQQLTLRSEEFDCHWQMQGLLSTLTTLHTIRLTSDGQCMDL